MKTVEVPRRATQETERERWARYEEAKRQVQAENLAPAAYEAAIRELARRLRL